jgi:hypothetical protein
MQSKQGILWVKISVVATFLIMIAAIRGNALPVNGVSTGQVSDAYPNLFAPAGLTFFHLGSDLSLLAGMCSTNWINSGR